MALKGYIVGILIAFAGALPVQGQDDSELAHFQQCLNGALPGSAEETLQKATLRVEQAREILDAREQAQALTELGLVHVNNIHDYDVAMDLFIQALAIEDSLQLDEEKVLTYLSISRVFELVGDYYKSAHFLEQSLELNARDRNINTLALILNKLGSINAVRGRMQEAFNNYQTVLQFKDDINKSFEAEALYNLGDLFRRQGEYEKALNHHKDALAISRISGDRHSEARSLNEIGIL